MKRKLSFVLLLLPLISVSTCFAADTTFVLLRIHGTEQVKVSLDKGHLLQQQLLTALQREWKKRSIVIISSGDSDRVASSPFDFAIEINILELIINDPIINQQNKSLSRDVHANTYKDEAEDLRKVEATVTADMIIIEKSVSAILRLSVSILKLPDAIVTSTEIMAETYKWENNSATYTGSLQALGLKDMELVKTKPKPVPTEDEIYKEVVRQFVNKSSRKIANSLN